MAVGAPAPEPAALPAKQPAVPLVASHRPYRVTTKLSLVVSQPVGGAGLEATRAAREQPRDPAEGHGRGGGGGALGAGEEAGAALMCGGHARGAARSSHRRCAGLKCTAQHGTAQHGTQRGRHTCGGQQ